MKHSQLASVVVSIWLLIANQLIRKPARTNNKMHPFTIHPSNSQQFELWIKMLKKSSEGNVAFCTQKDIENIRNPAKNRSFKWKLANRAFQPWREILQKHHLPKRQIDNASLKEPTFQLSTPKNLSKFLQTFHLVSHNLLKGEPKKMGLLLQSSGTCGTIRVLELMEQVQGWRIASVFTTSREMWKVCLEKDGV